MILEKSERLDDALEGADFVVLSISTGGLDAMEHDLKVPERYGIVQTVGDTVGPGGLFRALRNIPVVVAIARAMERLCPGAFMINLTNPMTTLTRAITKSTSVSCIGLCHELFGTLDMLSSMFSVPEEVLSVRVAGVNHFIWITEVAVQNRDVTEEAFRRIAEGEARRIALDHAGRDLDPFINTWGFRTEMCRSYGYLPAAGDRHLCEFFPGYLQNERERERLDLRVTTVDLRRKRLTENRDRVRKMADGEEEIPVQRSREEISDIIAAAWTGQDSVNIVNLPNTGQLHGLPLGAVVETYGVINGNGASGISFGKLPASLSALIYPHVFNQETIVDAALTGNKNLALQAFKNDPLVGSHPQAENIFEEMFSAHEEYLSYFESSSIQQASE